MATLLLIWIVLSAGIRCALAVDGENRNEESDVIVEKASKTNEVPTLIEDDVSDETYRVANSYMEALRNKTINRLNNMRERLNKNTLDSQNAIQVIRDIMKNEEIRSHTKLYVKITAFVIVTAVVGGLTLCSRRMCKKKRRTGGSDPEETVPSLQPEAQLDPSPPLLNASPEPQQPVVGPPEQCPYTLQQIPYPPPFGPFSDHHCNPPQQCVSGYSTKLTMHLPTCDGDPVTATKT